MFDRMAVTTSMIFAALLAGCSSPEVLPTTDHPPTGPQEVRFYQEEPKKYERLRTLALGITPDLRWDERGDATPAFEELKRLAGSVGANGILFKADPGSYDALALAGYHGAYYQVPVRTDSEQRTAVAQAIFVVEP